MSWEVEHTSEFEEWWDGLTVDEQIALEQRVGLLAEHGPALRRPIVGEIKGSAFDPQMKEIICEAGIASLRVLFIFDPRRTAICLLGGNKAGQWKHWYRIAIPQADDLYRTYLDELRAEGLI
jgi:hypothetical protein